MRQLEHGDGAGNTDGEPAGNRFNFGSRVAARIEKHRRCRRRRCGFAAVETCHLFCRGIVEKQKSAATDAGGFRFDQRQHELHGNGRVDGRAAGTQHLQARIDGQRIGRRHHVMLRRRFGRAGVSCVAAVVGVASSCNTYIDHGAV